MPIIDDHRPDHKHLHDDWFRLTEHLGWIDPKTLEVHRVKAPFEWDKGSVFPFVPRAMVPHGDEMTYPSALHDQSYKTYDMSRRAADAIFRRFLIEEFARGDNPDPFGKIKSWTAWSVVRMNLKAEFRWKKNV